VRVEVSGLSVRYGTHQALTGVNLSLQPGRVLGVVGPNGSGKSSLAKAVAGQVASEGQILFDGQLQRPRSIGYMPQDTASSAALTVLEAVLLGRLGQLRLRVVADDLAAVQQMLERLGIASLAARYLSELSGGQRQMVFLAQALVGNPTVLLLDEPISALDISHQLEVLHVVRELTRERGLSTLIVLHDLNAATWFADEVALLNQGVLQSCGGPTEVLCSANIEAAFGVQAEWLSCRDGRQAMVPTRRPPVTGYNAFR
jgi:iron complex transport system ATP-binding protein